MATNGVRAIFRKTLFRKTLLVIALSVSCSVATAPVWAAGQTEAHTNVYPFAAYPYYVEFRAAVDGVYGHSYIAYGRLNTLGQPATATYADIHPIGGFASMVLGHFFKLQASTSTEKDTLGHKLASRFRLPLTAVAYDRLQSVIARVRAARHSWSILAYNCNDFVADVARGIGLQTPTTVSLPYAFIPLLQAGNEGIIRRISAPMPGRLAAIQ
jgi:hypothetical protein